MRVLFNMVEFVLKTILDNRRVKLSEMIIIYKITNLKSRESVYRTKLMNIMCCNL